MSLDKFFGTKPPPPEERCSNPECRRKLGTKDIKFTLTKKGKSEIYCMACYKAIMRPREENEESI